MAQIRKHVTRDVVTLDATAPIRDAARLMADRKIGSIGVKEDGQLVGLVTERDLVIAVLARAGVSSWAASDKLMGGYKVTRMRDGTYSPYVPTRALQRFRGFGPLRVQYYSRYGKPDVLPCYRLSATREGLYGPMILLTTGIFGADEPLANWVLDDWEDNATMSSSLGLHVHGWVDDEYWFSRGGMSMQACLLLDVEPYLYRDDVKHALRATFNAIAVSHFPDVHLNTEHALPEMGDWRGDHFKSSDEANATGWLRYLFLREEGEHSGSLTVLLKNRHQLDEALVGAMFRRHQPSTLLVVEYCDTKDANGVFSKYSSFVVGGAVVPCHVDVSRGWVVKDTDIVDESIMDHELNYVRTNPHREWLEETFRLAGTQLQSADDRLIASARDRVDPG